MASRLNPREAMEFYQQVFGGELRLNTFGEFGPQGGEQDAKIMHAQLESDAGYTIMASDTAPGMGTPAAGDTMTISLSGDDADQLRAYWDRLSEGGTVTMPLEKQMWGDEFGMCVDRYGMPWMVNITAPEA